MKRILALVLSLILVVTLCACGATQQSASTEETPAPATDTTPAEASPQPVDATPQIDYPTKSVRVICPMAAGGNNDLTARKYADIFARNNIFDQPFVVENLKGGGGVVGMTELVNSEPDGYTIITSSQGAITIQTLRGNTTYAYGDMEPVACTILDPIALIVKADLPVNSIQELIDYANSKEGGLAIGFAGVGTFGHLAGMSFVAETGIPYTEVQFDGTATAMAAVLGGHVDAYMAGYADLNRFAASGEGKIIFVTTRNEKTPAEIESLTEFGIKGDFYQYFGFFVPKGTPQEIKDILFEGIKEAQKDDAIISEAEASGQNVVCIPGDEFQKMLDQDYENNKILLGQLDMLG